MIIKKHKKGIFAAEDDGFGSFSDFGKDKPFDDELLDEDDGSIDDAIDDLSDKVDDIQDSIDDLDESDPAIDIENNIENHYIAECEKCKGIFISAVIESDQVVDSITGTCPLCDEDSEQVLKWVVKAVE